MQWLPRRILQPAPGHQKLIHHSTKIATASTRDKLSNEHLKQLVEDICGKNWDETAAAALVLLMDEVERASFDRFDVANITVVIGKAAYKYTDHHANAAQRMIAAMRRELGRKDLVN